MGGFSAIFGAIAAIAGLSHQRSQQKAAKKAADQAAAQAAAQSRYAAQQAKLAEEDLNRANQKRPNTSAVLSAAEQAGRAGVSGTLLTGPQGVDQSTLPLGRSTLLGQ